MITSTGEYEFDSDEFDRLKTTLFEKIWSSISFFEVIREIPDDPDYDEDDDDDDDDDDDERVIRQIKAFKKNDVVCAFIKPLEKIQNWYCTEHNAVIQEECGKFGLDPSQWLLSEEYWNEAAKPLKKSRDSFLQNLQTFHHSLEEYLIPYLEKQGDLSGAAFFVGKTIISSVFLSPIAGAVSIASGLYSAHKSSEAEEQLMRHIIGKKKSFGLVVEDFETKLNELILGTWNDVLNKTLDEIHRTVEEHQQGTDSLPQTANADKAAPSASVMQNSNSSFEMDKLKLLCNCMKIDGTVTDEELNLIETAMDAAHFDPSESAEIIAQLRTDKQFAVDIAQYADDPTKALSILRDLAMMAKADSKVDITEKLYLKQIGKQLNISPEDIQELLQ